MHAIVYSVCNTNKCISCTRYLLLLLLDFFPHNRSNNIDRYLATEKCCKLFKGIRAARLLFFLLCKLDRDYITAIECGEMNEISSPLTRCLEFETLECRNSYYKEHFSLKWILCNVNLRLVGIMSFGYQMIIIKQKVSRGYNCKAFQEET